MDSFSSVAYLVGSATIKPLMIWSLVECTKMIKKKEAVK